MKKTVLILGIIFLLVGISIIPLSNSISILETSSNNVGINAQYLPIQRKSIPKKVFDKSLEPLSFAGIAITGGDFDEYHPSIAGAPGGEYYAMAEYTEDDVVWHPMLYGSADGIYWDPLVEFLYDNAEYTDMDQNAYGTYATFGSSPDFNGPITLLQGEIMDGWIWAFDVELDIYGFSNNRIACYNHKGPEGDPGEWNWGAITSVGYNGYNGNNIEGCPFIFYQYSADGGGTLSWIPVGECENVGSAMDLVTNMHYAVYDQDNGSGNYNLLIRKDAFGVWQQVGESYWKHPMVISLYITDTANLTYPSIAAYDNNVIIACQKNLDVIVYYSLNGLSSKTEVTVETDASYPEVAIAADRTVVITYIKDGTMYMKTSDDGGATWSSAEVVSDNQVNFNDRVANLDVYKGNVIGVWEDIRGDNVDIYYDMVFDIENYPPFAPFIDGKFITRWVELECYFTTADPDGDDVRYHIDWGDCNSNLTDFHKSGEKVTVRHTYSADGVYTISAYAEDIYGSAGPVSTKSFSRIKAINPLLRFLERYPLMIRILNIFVK
ncbi:hypothetical protein AYK24_05455 [Thermoplasmatales archaeon SG8-52-4]|nr:MAG: hypothetical protein AYK24_05455 [Thermoplasmatales archaeon SG8-52-4]